MSEPSSKRIVAGLVVVFSVVVVGWFAIGAAGKEASIDAVPVDQKDDTALSDSTDDRGPTDPDDETSALPADPGDGTNEPDELASNGPVTFTAVSSGGEKLRTEADFDLGVFTPEVSGNAVVFITVIMGNDSETVPPLLVNRTEAFATVEKNDVAARQLLAFAIPAPAGVPLQLDAAFEQSFPSTKVSWTVTFTSGTPGSVATEPGGKLETELIVATGGDGMVISSATIGTSGGDTITGDPAAIGSQQGEATRGQTFTQWATSATELTATWNEPAHAMGMAILID